MHEKVLHGISWTTPNFSPQTFVTLINIAEFCITANQSYAVDQNCESLDSPAFKFTLQNSPLIESILFYWWLHCTIKSSFLHFCLFALTSRWTFTSIRNNYLYLSTSKDREQANFAFCYVFFCKMDWTKNGLFLVFFVQLKVNYKQTNSCKFSCCFPMSANYKCARMVPLIWSYDIYFATIKICHQEGKHRHQCPQESLQMNADFNKITTVLPRLVPITINCNLVTNIQTATTSGWARSKSLVVWK